MVAMSIIYHLGLKAAKRCAAMRPRTLARWLPMRTGLIADCLLPAELPAPAHLADPAPL
jgi:hypothetical protein